MQFKTIDGTITALSGRMGDFMFRTYQNGKIIVYYKPKNRNNTTVMEREWYENDTVMARLKQITDALNLQIVKE